MTKDDAPFPSQVADKFITRLPDGMRDHIAKSAKANQRSMNAEIVARLQASFSSAYPNLPFAVVQAVEGEVEDKGCTEAEALINLVLAGQSKGGTVLNLRIAPGTTVKEVRDAMNAALKLIPPDSNVVSAQDGL